MTENRRLAAILAADVVGYSRLMQEDEAGTLAALKQRRKEIFEPTLARHRGRVVKLMGDGVLVEFGSAVAAVQCAVELQQAMSAAVSSNDANDQKRKTILLRIGVNLGDVIVEGSDLYGDGVNIAARLEALAEPGSICISAKVRDEVQGKIDVKLEDMGEVALKNMERPVHVFKISLTSKAPQTVPSHTKGPDRPSIAVLPFSNLSGDPEQQFFSDGITEDIITELSRFHTLFVIARNSSFQYRDKPTDMRRVGQELGAQYIVEGSVRKTGDRVRLTAQLIEAASGNHIWADRYDRPLTEIFSLQDDVVHGIARTVERRLSTDIAERAARKHPSSMAAYECVLKARENITDVAVAENLLNRAIELDASYAAAYAALTQVRMLQYWLTAKTRFLDEAVAAARTAVSLDPNDSYTHAGLGGAYTLKRDYSRAEFHIKRALINNPNDEVALRTLAHWLVRVGRPEEALVTLNGALQHDPFPSDFHWDIAAIAFIIGRRYREAVDALMRVEEMAAWNHLYLAAAYGQLGDLEMARMEAAETLKMQPAFTIQRHMLVEAFQNAGDAEPLVEGMRNAGLPE
jgi:Predicted integral membrane protein